MKKNRVQGVIICLACLLITGLGLYICFVAHTIYPDRDPTRLLATSGRTTTSSWFVSLGCSFYPWHTENPEYNLVFPEVNFSNNSL